MQTKNLKKSPLRRKRFSAKLAVARYKAENEEIIQALDIMKRARMVKNLHPATLDRQSYHSI